MFESFIGSPGLYASLAREETLRSSLSSEYKRQSNSERNSSTYSEPPGPADKKLVYLLSEYPLLEHTYLLREVRELRRLGWDIQTISIRRPAKRSARLSADEEAELGKTWYIVDSSVMTHVASQFMTLLSRPVRYFRGLTTAWRYGGLHLRRFLLAHAYFLEAITAGRQLQKAGIRHVHSVYSTTVALILSRVFDVNLSMTLHGSAEFMDPQAFALADKVHSAQQVCSISYFGKSQIMVSAAHDDWHKLRVTPLGVDVREWSPPSFRENPRPFRLISIGRLVETKGCPLLLEAVARLRDRDRDVELTFVGDGPLHHTLEWRAQELGILGSVSFAGWRSQQEMRTLFAASDACVLASFAEGVPVVLMESMAAGVPCVAPRITGIPELIREGRDGLLFTPSNLDELVSAIAQLFDNPKLRQSLALSGRQRVCEKYDLFQNTLRLSEIFHQWMAPRAASQPPSRERPRAA
jgi:glycosyltransferase involved in cell wall biosynthesis